MAQNVKKRGLEEENVGDFLTWIQDGFSGPGPERHTVLLKPQNTTIFGEIGSCISEQDEIKLTLRQFRQPVPEDLIDEAMESIKSETNAHCHRFLLGDDPSVSFNASVWKSGPVCHVNYDLYVTKNKSGLTTIGYSIAVLHKDIRVLGISETEIKKSLQHLGRQYIIKAASDQNKWKRMITELSTEPLKTVKDPATDIESARREKIHSSADSKIRGRSGFQGMVKKIEHDAENSKSLQNTNFEKIRERCSSNQREASIDELQLILTLLEKSLGISCSTWSAIKDGDIESTENHSKKENTLHGTLESRFSVVYISRKRDIVNVIWSTHICSLKASQYSEELVATTFRPKAYAGLLNQAGVNPLVSASSKPMPEKAEEGSKPDDQVSTSLDAADVDSLLEKSYLETVVSVDDKAASSHTTVDTCEATGTGKDKESPELRRLTGSTNSEVSSEGYHTAEETLTEKSMVNTL